jgi:hypothetical protein
VSTRYQLARAFKRVRRTTGDITLGTSANWANVDTAVDFVLAAAVGDELEYAINGYLTTTAGSGSFDVCTVVAGAPVNSFANGGAVTAAPPPYGVQGWTMPGSTLAPVAGSAWYTVVAGDLVAGYVTLRLRYQLGVASRVLYSSANNPLFLCARNLGPADPN